MYIQHMVSLCTYFLKMSPLNKNDTNETQTEHMKEFWLCETPASVGHIPVVDKKPEM